MYRFTGFTEKANRALNSAIESAEDLGHTYIGSEHLLMGLLKEDGASVAAALSAKRITPARVEEIVKRTVGVGVPTVLSPDDFTPRCKHIIESSVSLARDDGASFVGSEFLLLALAKENDSCGGYILNELGVSQHDLINDLTDSRAKSAYQQKAVKRQSQKSDTPTLNQYGQDLTLLAQNGGVDPVIGREKEIERVVQILSRRTKNNPCLIGEPGVGKTAIAEGLALRISDGNVPEILKDKRIVSVDLTGMVAGTKYRGDFEERIKTAISEVIKAQNVILFIDELHTLIGAGSAEGAVDAANILKPSLARSELQVIGATTVEEYRRHIEKDSALERRFQPVKVGEPSEKETLEILKGVKDKYELHHKVKITDGAMEAAVKLSSRYITDRFLPDKAIDLIDEACSRVRLRAYTPPKEIKEAELKLKEITEKKSASVDAQDYEKAAALRDREKRLLKQLNEMRGRWKEQATRSEGEITPHEIAEIVSSWTGIPVLELTKEERQRLLELESELHKRVIGQDKAVSAVARAVRRGRSGLKDPKRPMGSFIFLGPTGVGKTELCKALGQAVFGDENAVIRFDMSEFMEKHNTSKLIGSPPGYVGYDEGGQLTEKVRRKPYSVVLFDEIEKAHPDIFNMLLQILDDGILTDSQGRRVDFRNTIIIMTSNIGAKLIAGGSGVVGFSSGISGALGDSKIYDAVMSELKRTFRPEFLNRVDEAIVFKKLTREDIGRITRRLLSELTSRLEAMKITVSFTSAAVEAIADKGFDEVYGARPIRREIQARIEDKLSEMILSGEVEKDDAYVCSYKDGEFLIEKEKRVSVGKV